MKKKAIGLVTYKPNEVFLEFLNFFSHYDVYIIIDDNTSDYNDLKKKYSNLFFVQIDNNFIIGYSVLDKKTEYASVSKQWFEDMFHRIR